MMNDTTTLETYEHLTSKQADVEQMQIAMERSLPAMPFPRKYVLSVFVNLQDALKAAFALSAAGFDKRDIYLLQSYEFVKSVIQDQSPFEIITSIDYESYVREAHRQRVILAVRPDRYAHLKQIRDVLARHHGYLANYIDTWTVTELLK